MNIPQNVGEWKKLLADLPDNLPFDIMAEYVSLDISLDIKEQQIGWDKTACPIMGKVLVLELRMQD